MRDMTFTRGQKQKILKQQGFSLLEVLVAFTILSVSLGLLLQIFSGGLRNAAISQEYTQATLFAQSILAALGREAPLVEGTEQGRIDETYDWRTTITPYQAEGLPSDDRAVKPYRIVVEIIWRNANRSIRLETLRLASVDNP